MRFRANCILLGVAAAASVALASPEERPYTVIAARNVFHLVDKPVVEPPKLPEAPRPQITLQGLTDILGRRQAMLKISHPAQPGAPARDQSEVLTEGSRVGDVELLQIDFKKRTVRVKNRGTEETVAVQTTPVAPGPGAVIASIPSGLPTPPAPPRDLPPGLKDMRARLQQARVGQ